MRRRRTNQNRAFQSLSPPLVLHLVAVVQPAKTIRDEIHEIGRSAGEMAGTHISFLLLLYARFQLGGDTSNVGGAAGLSRASSLQNIFTRFAHKITTELQYVIVVKPNKISGQWRREHASHYA